MPVVASMTETLMVNVPVWLVFAAGDLIVTWGVAVSTLNVRKSEAFVLSTSSWQVTDQVWAPVLNAETVWDVVEPLVALMPVTLTVPSTVRLQSSLVSTVSFAWKLKVTLFELLAGLESERPGLVLSTLRVRVSDALSLREWSVALTWKPCEPSARPVMLRMTDQLPFVAVPSYLVNGM